MASKRIIDLSKFNVIKDYNALIKGCDGVILRIGYRSTSQNGKIVEDSGFENHYKNLKGKIPLGIYFFTEAISEKEAIEEANWVVTMIKKYHIEPEFPVAVDTEYVNNQHNGRSDKLSKADRTKYVLKFCNTLKEFGYRPMIYASDSWFKSNLDYEQVKPYLKWVARYSTKSPEYATHNLLGWQKTSTHKVSGLDNDLDMTEWYGIISKKYVRFDGDEPVSEETEITIKSVKLQDAPLYAASSSTIPSRKNLTGTYYIWNDEVKNGKIRITTKPEYAGVMGKVTGWINWPE